MGFPGVDGNISQQYTPSEPPLPGGGGGGEGSQDSAPPRTGSLRPGWKRHWGFVGTLSGQIRNIQQPQSVPGALENLQVLWKAWPASGWSKPHSPHPRIFLGILFPEVKNCLFLQPARQTGQLGRECGITRLPEGPLWGPGKVLSHGNFPVLVSQEKAITLWS